MPHMAAGFLNDPPRSLPMPSTDPPPARSAPSPPDEPPGSRATSCGLDVAPYAGLLHCSENMVCGTLVWQNGTAPNALSCDTTGESEEQGLSVNSLRPEKYLTN